MELHLTRRSLALATSALLLAPGAGRAATLLGEDGLYVQDWYVESFLDLSEDFAAARAAGKGFALQWSQRGCPLCKRLHTEYFADPVIESYVRDHFSVVHLDIFGSREVTGFESAARSEKALAGQYAVRATPTFQFFGMRGGRVVEVARLPGLLPKPEFLAMFKYVEAGAYDGTGFEAWMAAQKAP
ncbi:SoxW family protein [Ancylobacter radicis]|uniref:Thioredoxin family protein n=1 Tax=Ancylobacter radicis TaxID=2836179 RepID=A0ABS5RBJ1_9HYPH|nr:thioredoxin family protein [Ancylobacter radicis]MBS9479018.1 thioredoxin family protein [Ancylobacter radicis]